MESLRKYEKASGQLVNNDKSYYYIHHKVSARVNSKIKRHTDMRNGSFTFTYLGCPVFYGRRKLIYYKDLIKKVMKSILSWQNRLLSFGGRYVLVNHVLQTMPVYLLSATNPPSGVIKQLHKIFTKFFWSNTVGVKSKHWVAWDKLCLPKDEGGIGLRSLTDISNALFAKLWWNFRYGRSLWSSYMLNKYFEPQIFWYLRNGTSRFWYENWTRLGALYYITPDAAREKEIEHIKDNIKVPDGEEDDEPCWMLETSGKFSVKSAWEFLRHRESQQTSYRFMWEKGLPIKISFFMWRVWKGRISTDDILKRMMINIPSRCWCCIPTDGIGLHQMIMAWWTAETKSKLQPIYRAMPAVIIWSLWKRRKYIKHGGSVTFYRLKQQHLSRYKPKFYYAKVLWRMPPSERLKCNTDGSSRGTPGISSYGFYIRDSSGDLVQLETDSLVLQNILQDSWITPWELRNQIEEIKQDMRTVQVQSNHIFREGNKLPDFLANQTLDHAEIKVHEFKLMPSEGRIILNMDK
ncbi:uncharacterized protein LOC132610954 [Lycium barbarum]|uniref:uncharacterized protein LOC132610954 n=1 Tax=Lycium barbarum TaxID=112863 RepID=UPI00293F4EB5|nr:uncharacterized protein LOC132610954 [Lycium barbarum]